MNVGLTLGLVVHLSKNTLQVTFFRISSNELVSHEDSRNNSVFSVERYVYIELYILFTRCSTTPPRRMLSIRCARDYVIGQTYIQNERYLY
jgi:hypothetical protein